MEILFAIKDGYLIVYAGGLRIRVPAIEYPPMKTEAKNFLDMAGFSKMVMFSRKKKWRTNDPIWKFFVVGLSVSRNVDINVEISLMNKKNKRLIYSGEKASRIVVNHGRKVTTCWSLRRGHFCKKRKN